MSEWRTGRAAEVGREEWAAMANILYPPEIRHGGCSDAESDRIAIHTTYEAVMALRAQVEQIVGQMKEIGDHVSALHQREARGETLWALIEEVPSKTVVLLSRRAIEFAIAGLIVWQAYHWLGWAGGLLAYAACSVFALWREFRANLRRI